MAAKKYHFKNKQPNPQDPLDPVTLSSRLFDYAKNPSMHMLHRTWFRNILYYMGEQWFNWSRNAGTFKRIMPSEFTPTPVSNMIRDHARVMKALILNKEFRVTVWPNSNEVEDRDAAEIGKCLLEHMDAENDEEFEDENELTALWLVLTGNAFDRTFPETNDYSWGLDSAGKPIKKSYVTTENISPFNIGVDGVNQKFRKKRYIGIKSVKERGWVEDTFGVKLQKGEQDDKLINYERALSVLVANVSPWKGEGIQTLSRYEDSSEDLTMFHEFEYKPCKRFPNGLYVIVAGGEVVEEYDRMIIPVQKDGRWDYSITDYHYHFVPGRFWSDPSVNDLISPQNTVNSIDADLYRNRKSVGRPMLVIPSDIHMERASAHGQHLLVVKYDALTSGGIAPEISRGTPYPSQVLQEREINMAVTQDVSGDPKNVLRGKAPSTQASGVMVDILRDAAEQGHIPDIKRFYRARKRTYAKRLRLAEEVFTEERIVKIGGPGKRTKIRKFKSADLRGNTDVRLEMGGGLASTRMGQTQMFINLADKGFFNRSSDLDPDFRQEILRRIGLSGFKDHTNTDVERAMEENAMVARTKMEDMSDEQYKTPDGKIVNIPIVRGIFIALPDMERGEPIVISEDPMFKFDNHAIHYETHRKFILSSEFRQMESESKEFLIAHTDMHMLEIQAQMALERQAIAQEMAMTGKGQQPTGGPKPGAIAPEILPREGPPQPPGRGQSEGNIM